MTASLWQTLRVTPSHEGVRDAVAAALFTGGAEGLHEDGVSFVTHVPDDHDLVFLRAEVVRADPAAQILVTPLDPATASPELHGTVQAHDHGSFGITPPWLANQYDPAKTIIVEPGMVITFKEKSAQLLRDNMEQMAGHNVPGWIEWNPAQLTAKINALPTPDDVPFEVNMNLIIEFYR